mgnify:CR=1 FL=1
MVYRDHWALFQWYTHYARHLGAENLYVVAHGADPEISKICPRANIITVPRDNLTGFDRARGDMLNGLQDALGAIFDWVIRTDVDELICVDPAHFPSLKDVFEKQADTNCLFALGIDVVEAADDKELGAADLALGHRKNAVFSGHYSKAFAVRRGTHMVRHGVENTKNATFTMPQGVYLLHLKYANIDALQVSNEHRIAIANGPERGLPGESWRDAPRSALRFLRRFESLPNLPWEQSVAAAYAVISERPETEADKGVMRARSIRFEHKTILPSWFQKH